MSRTRLILIPVLATEPAPYLILDAGGAVLQRGRLALDAGETPPPMRTVAIAPGGDVSVRWLDLPVGGVTQVRAAALWTLRDDLAATPDRVTVSLGRAVPTGEPRMVVVASRALVEAWGDYLDALGIQADVILPDMLTLEAPLAEDGLAAVTFGTGLALRGHRFAATIQPDLLDLIAGDRMVHPVTEEAEVERLMIAAALSPEINLLDAVGREKATDRRGWRLAAGLAAFLLGLVVAFNVPFNWHGVARHVERHLRQSVGGNQLLRQEPSPVRGELALIGSYLRFLGAANAAPVAALLAAGLGWALVRARPLAVLVLVPAVTYYLLFLRLHGTHHLRYVLPVYLLLTWPAAALAARALGDGPARRRLALAALGAALGWGGLEAASVGLRYAHDPRYEAEAWLRAHVPAGATVLGVAPNYTLPRFPPGVRVERREIWDYGGRQVGDLVDLAPAYVAIGTNLPARRARRERIEEFFQARGYRRQVEFAPRVSFFAREVEDLHSLSPRVAIYARAGAAATAPAPGDQAYGTR